MGTLLTKLNCSLQGGSCQYSQQPPFTPGQAGKLVSYLRTSLFPLSAVLVLYGLPSWVITFKLTGFYEAEHNKIPVERLVMLLHYSTKRKRK
jgi:hypothetical protein